MNDILNEIEKKESELKAEHDAAILAIEEDFDQETGEIIEKYSTEVGELIDGLKESAKVDSINNLREEIKN